MLNYKLHKKGKSARRVAVRVEEVEIHVLALIICAALAFFIWLYIVGISQIPKDPPAADTTPVTDVAPEDGDTEAPTDPVTEAPTEAETNGPLVSDM